MAVGLAWPLLISVLRLVFISTLTLVNLAALYRVVSSKKYKTGQRQERLLATTIILISLVYLTVVWSPFTFSALKHDLKDLKRLHDTEILEGEFSVQYIDLIPQSESLKGALIPRSEYLNGAVKGQVDQFSVEYAEEDHHSKEEEVNDEFVLEYIDIATGETFEKVSSEPRRVSRSAHSGGDVEAKWTVFLPSNQGFQVDTLLSAEVPSLDPQLGDDGGKSSALFWKSDVQDFVTSSCAYSLAFTAIVRVVIMRRFVMLPASPWVLGFWSGLVVGVPSIITLLVRKLAGTNTHFAPHKPEYTSAGYFLYNIICDVHISEQYVVSVFLEWAVLFTLLLIVLAVLFSVTVRSNRSEPSDSYGPLSKEDSSSSNGSSVESWTRDVVLFIGAIWSWPAKPVLVLVLYCLYGSHWTNSVCWVAHVVVAIAVVFMPLAVFLSRHQHEGTSVGIYIIDKDLNLKDDEGDGHNGKEKRRDELGICSHVLYDNAEKKQNDLCKNYETREAAGPDDLKSTESQSGEERSRVKENLKFYLNKDSLKRGLRPTTDQEDRHIILDHEWQDTSISEA